MFLRQLCGTNPVRAAVSRALLAKAAKTPLPFGQQELVLHQGSWRALLAGVVVNAQQP